VSGGGKTRLVDEFAYRAEYTMASCFDDFDDTIEPPADVKSWLLEGGDYSAWRTPKLARHLKNIKEGSIK
jgi:hypothetical protein